MRRPDPQEVREEQILMLRVGLRADLTAHRLGHLARARHDALALIERTKQEILELCLDKDFVFELVLRPRFMRILNERVLSEWGMLESTN